MESQKLGQRSFQIRYALWALVLHAGALALLPIYFSWSNLLIAFAFAGITAYSMGIFHHMYFSHASFKAHPVLEKLGALFGTLTWRGAMASPIKYVALHRIHHRYADQDFDPHSPVHGVFHSLLGWNWNHSEVFANRESYYKLSGKVAKNSWLRFLDRHVDLLQGAFAAVLFVVGGLIGGALARKSFDLQTAIGVMVYGVFAKTLIVVYAANAVDLINHTVGYRNYETKDQSTNSFMMAALHLGGAISWHNNHHARPGYFMVKRNWWEFDFFYLVLKGLETLGWVSDVRSLDESIAPKSEKKVTDYLKQNSLKAAWMIGVRLFQLSLGLILFVFIWNSKIDMTLQVLSSLPALAIAAIGFHNLALVGHEGTHFNLSKNKMFSSMLGTFFSSLTPFHLNTGFAASHAEHHVHTNTEKDPDIRVFQKFNSLSSRLFCSRSEASREYLKITLSAAFEKSTPVKIAGLKSEQVKTLARFNLLTSAFFLGVYVVLSFVFGKVFLIALLASFAGTYFLSAVRPYFEHADTDSSRMTNSRTFQSILLDFVFGTINYHLAHHLYPRVPAYNLAAFHEWLVETQAIQVEATVTSVHCRDLVTVLRKARYGVRRVQAQA